MADEPTGGSKAFGDIAPALGEYTDKILFGGVWERPGLSKARPQSHYSGNSRCALPHE